MAAMAFQLSIDNSAYNEVNECYSVSGELSCSYQ